MLTNEKYYRLFRCEDDNSHYGNIKLCINLPGVLWDVLVIEWQYTVGEETDLYGRKFVLNAKSVYDLNKATNFIKTMERNEINTSEFTQVIDYLHSKKYELAEYFDSYYDSEGYTQSALVCITQTNANFESFHIISYIGERAISEITGWNILKWENYLKKYYSNGEVLSFRTTLVSCSRLYAAYELLTTLHPDVKC